MGVTNVSAKTRLLLWGKSAGWCQYRGCIERLTIDPLTKAEFNQAYIAHIVADKPGGPRGDERLSPLLKDDLSNLMLLCDRHHRLVDKEDVDGHPVDFLKEMKEEQEFRIGLQTQIQPERQSEIILFSSNVGEHSAFVNYQKSSNALARQGRYPARDESNTINLGYRNSYLKDNEDDFWRTEPENIRRQVEQNISSRLRNQGIPHMSIFGIGPMPLLMYLGRLLSDISAASVYQLHREPVQDWLWRDQPEEFEYCIRKPENALGIPVLKLSLSWSIEDERIEPMMSGSEYSTWEVTIEDPNNDFLHSKIQLQRFRELIRPLFDEIRDAHGQDSIIHLFPAVPVSIAVETGRAWQSKAHPTIKIYDQNQSRNGFIETITLQQEEE
jgi:SMODS-associated and fused to various effectors sensor domain